MPADPNMKILVVDDMSTLRRIVKNIMQQLGFANVEEAENGQDALKKNQGGIIWIHHFRLEHAGETGIDLLRTVRADD